MGLCVTVRFKLERYSDQKYPKMVESDPKNRVRDFILELSSDLAEIDVK